MTARSTPGAVPLTTRYRSARGTAFVTVERADPDVLKERLKMVYFRWAACQSTRALATRPLQSLGHTVFVNGLANPLLVLGLAVTRLVKATGLIGLCLLRKVLAENKSAGEV